MNKIIVVALVLSTSYCLALETKSSVRRTISDVSPNSGGELLKITFDSGVSVNMGNEITPTQAKNIPTVDWNADDNSYYTIACTDPDAPSPSNPFLGEVLLWLVVNIPGKDISSGETIAEYYAAAPPKGAELNRVIFLLYKQRSHIDFKEKLLGLDTFEGRYNYSVKKLADKYGLGEPVAANFYLTKFDPYCLVIYKRFNCCFEYNEK